MVLRALPPDYAPGDTPTAAQMNGLKDHARNSLDRYTTVLRRGTLVQQIPHNALTPISWQSVVGGYNGLGWAIGTPSRITCPSGADGRYAVILTAQFAAGAGGFRYTELLKNNATSQPGLFVPGDGTLVAWLATAWEVQMVAGDYFEIRLFHNKTTVGVLNLDVYGDSPQVSVRRVEL
jgi:hypothetical protein